MTEHLNHLSSVVITKQRMPSLQWPNSQLSSHHYITFPKGLTLFNVRTIYAIFTLSYSVIAILYIFAFVLLLNWKTMKICLKQIQKHLIKRLNLESNRYLSDTKNVNRINDELKAGPQLSDFHCRGCSKRREMEWLQRKTQTTKWWKWKVCHFDVWIV